MTSIRKHASLLRAKVQVKQDVAATAAAAAADAQHTISLSDSFSDLEHDDEEAEAQIAREDAASRHDALQKELVPRESPEQLKSRQVQFSKVFSALEQQDDQIQDSLKTDDLK